MMYYDIYDDCYSLCLINKCFFYFLKYIYPSTLKKNLYLFGLVQYIPSNQKLKYASIKGYREPWRVCSH